jgi:transcriptional regulator with XRE-family HTH domain
MLAAKKSCYGSLKGERNGAWRREMGCRDTFGTFLKSKRKDREITVRAMAEKVRLAVGYYCDIESGRRYPPDREILERMMDALLLPDEDRKVLYDLAGRARSEAPPDLPGYINEYEPVRVALRLAKDKGSMDDWRRFISDLNRKG